MKGECSSLLARYRSLTVFLEIYAGLAESMQTGQPYQTRLYPLPSDQIFSHPARQSNQRS